MKKLYFSCSVRGGRENLSVYQLCISVLKEKYQILTVHLGADHIEKYEEKMTDEQIYLQDRRFLDEAELVVAECSTPSIGVGYELAYAEKREIPCYILYRENGDRKLSAMISGDSYFQKFPYKDERELEAILKKL